MLRKSIKDRRVFMAIDNVFDSSKFLANAKMYCQLENGYGSVVMKIACFLDQLLMLKSISNCIVSS